MKKVFGARKREDSRSWGVLYILFAATAGLLWLEGRSTLTPFEHKVALLGVMLAFYALTFLWLDAEEKRLR